MQKKKLIYSHFYILGVFGVLFFNFLFFVSLNNLAAASCTVVSVWQDNNFNTLAQGANVKTDPNIQYRAVATYTGCVGMKPSLTLNGPSYGGLSAVVDLGGDIIQSPESRNAVAVFSQDGQYYFKAQASPDKDTGAQYASAVSSTVQASSNGGQTTNPSSQSLPSGNSYACTAGNSKYACSPGNKSDLSDVPQGYGGNCDKVGLDPETIPSGECGCSALDYNAGTCKNGQAVTPSTAPSGTNTGVPNTGINNNSGTALFNPLPEDDLVHVFLLITQGLLATLAILAAVFIVVGGVQMVLAAGNEEGITKAKNTITWSVVGLIVATLSFSIVAIVLNFLQADLQGNATTTSQTTNPQGSIPNPTVQGSIPNGSVTTPSNPTIQQTGSPAGSIP